MSQLSIEHTRQLCAQRSGRSAPADPGAVIQRFIQGSAGLGDDAALHLESGLDVGHEVIAPGDRFLLCSAPVWRSVDLAQMKACLGEETASDAATACVHIAARRGRPGSATAAVLFVD